MVQTLEQTTLWWKGIYIPIQTTVGQHAFQLFLIYLPYSERVKDMAKM